MTFTPVVPISGLLGWQFLSRTMDRQIAAFDASAGNTRASDYFRDKIGAVQSPSDLVSDRQLLSVALGAFGLQDDLPNRAFLLRVLGDGVDDDGALANRLADKRYREFAVAFGLGTGQTPRTNDDGFADRILGQYRVRQFEEAVGARDESLRVALTLQRELPDIAQSADSDTTKWLRILGNPPLRLGIERALGLPPSFAALDLDTQVSVLREKSDARFGSAEASVFADPDALDSAIRLSLLRSDAAALSPALSGASVALSLLQSLVR